MEYHAIKRETDSFQQPLPQEAIKEMCRIGLGEIEPNRITELSSGLYNNTYIIEFGNADKVILRVAPIGTAKVYTHEIQLMRREYNIQPYLAPVSDLIPKVLFADFTGNIINRDYMFQSFLEGELWDAVKDSLTATENDFIWSQVGQISQKISMAQNDKFGFPAPKKQFNKWGSFIHDFLDGMIADLAGFGLTLIPEIEVLREHVAGFQNVLNEIKTPHLIHGDLWPKNILISRKDGEINVTGVLDSERAYFGDLTSEWIHHVLDTPASFWKSYQLPPDDHWAAIRKRIYRGVYLTQGVLESTRFHHEIQWFLEEIRKTNEWLRESRGGA